MWRWERGGERGVWVEPCFRGYLLGCVIDSSERYWAGSNRQTGRMNDVLLGRPRMTTRKLKPTHRLTFAEGAKADADARAWIALNNEWLLMLRGWYGRVPPGAERVELS
jgi:hypothetical protein